MKLLLITILSVFFLASCAHHHRDMEHHHHKRCDKNCKQYHDKGEMFDMFCAQSVSEGDLHVKGNKDYKLEHGGETYYFSSKKKMNKFKDNVKTNSERARRNWETGANHR